MWNISDTASSTYRHFGVPFIRIRTNHLDIPHSQGDKTVWPMMMLETLHEMEECKMLTVSFVSEYTVQGSGRLCARASVPDVKWCVEVMQIMFTSGWRHSLPCGSLHNVKIVLYSLHSVKLEWISEYFGICSLLRINLRVLLQHCFDMTAITTSNIYE